MVQLHYLHLGLVDRSYHQLTTSYIFRFDNRYITFQPNSGMHEPLYSARDVNENGVAFLLLWRGVVRGEEKKQSKQRIDSIALPCFLFKILRHLHRCKPLAAKQLCCCIASTSWGKIWRMTQAANKLFYEFLKNKTTSSDRPSRWTAHIQATQHTQANTHTHARGFFSLTWFATRKTVPPLQHIIGRKIEFINVYRNVY